mmetsp:Transcript_7342/g.26747  ORF Transcript_7342/g.26747 Transcript_7342/m.26747 type:complete len:302 (+) Transcript_7342:637-1542(+)
MRKFRMTSAWLGSRCQKMCCKSKRSTSATSAAFTAQAATRKSNTALTSLRSEISTGGSMLSRKCCRNAATTHSNLPGNTTLSARRCTSKQSTAESKCHSCNSEHRSEGLLGVTSRAALNKLATPLSDTQGTNRRTKKRSYRASSPSSSGNSLDAATAQSSGTEMRASPLSNARSFKRVKSEFNIEELALNTSSKNATTASGRYPSTLRVNLSFSSSFRDRGPKSSSGTEKRVKSLSKNLPLQIFAKRRASKLFAVPGGPTKRMCSPASTDTNINFASTLRSINPSVSASKAWTRRSSKGIC